MVDASQGAKYGDRVVFHFIGRFEDGSIFSGSQKNAPVQATLGSGELLAGLELGIIGMKPGERKQVTIMASDAYGEHNPALIVKYPRSQLHHGDKMMPGQQLEMKTTEGRTIYAAVLAVDGDVVTLDMNHPLAGKNLSYEIVLLAINPAASPPSAHL